MTQTILMPVWGILVCCAALMFLSIFIGIKVGQTLTMFWMEKKYVIFPRAGVGKPLKR